MQILESLMHFLWLDYTQEDSKGVKGYCMPVCMPPNVDGSSATLTEPRQFILTEKIQFLRSSGLKKHFFMENLSSQTEWFRVWKKCTGSVADGNKHVSNCFA